MKSKANSPIFFAGSDDFRGWLERHHQIITEQWVGFHRKSSGRVSITWPEAVDEALCFGWIDGLRKTIDTGSYKIRFTPRRPSSIWSAINIARMTELILEERVCLAGMTAFQKRTLAKSHVYSYENHKNAILSSPATKLFRTQRAAWKFFQQQSKSSDKPRFGGWLARSARKPGKIGYNGSSKAGRRLWR